MNNPELCRYYMQQENTVKIIPNVPGKNIIDILDEAFDKNWTWELTDERFYADGQSVSTTVTVYLPGRVLTGRAMCKLKDYLDNHERAIDNACFRLMGTMQPYQSVSPLLESEMAKTQNMTAEQIMASLSHTASLNPVNSDTQPINSSSSEVGIPEVSQNTINPETAQMPATPPAQLKTQESIPTTQTNTSATPPVDGVYGPDDPQPRYKGFSQSQVDKLNQFKADFDILNDDMFANYVKTWDKALKSKGDITPSNVNAFLAWVDSLGKMDC